VRLFFDASEPESECDGLLEQQPGMLVFAAAVETAQHQEKKTI
jgi:hypothetical protein